MMFSCYFLLLLLACLHMLLYILYWKARRNFKDLPSYSQLPFLGSIHWFIGGGGAIFRQLKKISKIMDETNLPFVVWIGPRPLMLLSNPDDVKTVTNSYLEKPYLYKFGKDWLGDGLVTASGELWKKNIKRIAGSFTQTMVDGFQDVFNTKAMELVNMLKEEADKEPFDAMPYFSYTTLGAICQTGLGVSYSSANKETKDYYEAFKMALELLIKRGLNLVYHFDCVYQLSRDHKNFLKSIAIMQNVSNNVIKMKLRERANKKRGDKDNYEDFSEPSFKTVLDVLLDLNEVDPSMDEKQIRSEVQTIIVGGQETVAAALCYVTLMLGCNPDVQKKLYNEVKDIFRDGKCNIDKEDLARLVYCEAVVKETLRMFPPLPVVTRYADRDLKIKSCTIPKGTLCSLNLYGVGRSERAWGSNVDQFIPERWLPPHVPSVTAFMPFSIGRRDCIGKRYALAILKTLLAYCVKNFQFISEAENIEFVMDVGLRAVKGNLLQVRIRN